MMLSNGGVATDRDGAPVPDPDARVRPGGRRARPRRASARQAGRADLLSFDMGGTTAKLCLIEDGQPLVAHEFEVDRVYRFEQGSGLPVKAPVIDMIEIGAGGGSIARVDALGLLTVGPDSAGADPGPACYGLRRHAADGHRRRPGARLPRPRLLPRRPDDARRGRRAPGARSARSPSRWASASSEAAWGIHRLVNENMANAARVHAVERGHDPRGLPLFAFGGAGPVHGARRGAGARLPAR